MIDMFSGKYDFLSNFYTVPVTYQGITYQNSEAAFQAAKCPDRAVEFISLSGAEAKKLGRRVDLRPDWENMKDRIMFEIVFNKFSQNSDLAKQLMETGQEELIEGNTWNDRYWGVCDGKGLNRLGKILMRVRSLMIKAREYEQSLCA